MYRGRIALSIFPDNCFCAFSEAGDKSFNNVIYCLCEFIFLTVGIVCHYDVVVMFRSLYCNIYCSLELWQCLFRDVDISWIRVCDVLHFILLVLLSQDSIFSIISQC